MERIFENIEGFEWDLGNETKNWSKHRVSREECEQVFFEQPLVIATDEGHSQAERRYQALGHTGEGRRLFLVFTVRAKNIRIISARDMSRAERNHYEKVEKDPDF